MARLDLRDYRFLGATQSMCPECLSVVPAKILSRAGRVYFRKQCQEHGTREDFVCSDDRWFDRMDFSLPGKIPIQFGVEPRVAMLSYSTGSSGSGADVEKVRRATELVRERAPHLPVDGPIQYDAAVDQAVAATKATGSPVAGRATVLIFPDLNTGNNTYKAVQRTANAVAVGPVLQGLNKPVNDLSRGATVDDIVNTVAITAIQAQAEPSGQPAPSAPTN